MPRVPSCLPAGLVQIRHCDAATLMAAEAARARVLTWLDEPERTRAARYRHDKDRAMFLAGRAMARTLVGRALDVAPGGWRSREGRHGRPEVDAEGCDVRFNLAHSADLVVCALARGRDVGIDVEDRERPPIDRHLVRRYCSPAEAADIEARGDDGWRDRFLTYWTLKEAYLKACGLGISVPLAELNFVVDADNASARLEFLGSLASHDDRWAFRLTTVGPRHLLAIAVSVADGSTPAIDLAPFDETV
jgi:4'-phosphopantetheinyl transferase